MRHSFRVDVVNRHWVRHVYQKMTVLLSLSMTFLCWEKELHQHRSWSFWDVRSVFVCPVTLSLSLSFLFDVAVWVKEAERHVVVKTTCKAEQKQPFCLSHRNLSFLCIALHFFSPRNVEIHWRTMNHEVRTREWLTLSRGSWSFLGSIWTITRETLVSNLSHYQPIERRQRRWRRQPQGQWRWAGDSSDERNRQTTKILQEIVSNVKSKWTGRWHWQDIGRALSPLLERLETSKYSQ